MKKKVSLIIASLLILTAVISGTFAWLTFTTPQKTNTFTVGTISIELDEPHYVGDINAKIIPGSVISKDPTVTVLANSEDCYVFVMVENQLVIDGEVVGVLNFSSDWTAVDFITDADTKITKTIYKYKDVVSFNTADQVLPSVFTQVTIDGAKVVSSNIKDLANQKIILKAFAYQAAGQDYAIEEIKTSIIESAKAALY